MTEKRKYETMFGNKNAEKIIESDALNILNDLFELSLDSQYDFIGEIVRVQGIRRSQLTYLTNKFESCKSIYVDILSNLESNCFGNAKKGTIKEATAIINLKSNHKWTDRQQIDQDVRQIVWSEERTEE